MSGVLGRAQSPSWIFGLRRADVARARSSQCCFCGTTRVTIGHCRRRERKKEREPVATCQDERQVFTQAWSSDRFKRDDRE